MNLSIIIPAHDADETLDDTLRSVRAQTLGTWEAIVVDDGSTDGTATVAERHAAQDARVRLVVQAPRGVSAARNAGLRTARHDWVLFLDADDWVLPRFAERVREAAKTLPEPDAVCTGWRRVTPDGRPVDESFRPDYDQIFDLLAQFCPFAIHSCVVRRSLVERVGGFDEAMVVGEDWDLWQRVARAGARFRGVDDVLACYRVRPGSASGRLDTLVGTSLRLIRLGHAPDVRVREPSPRHAQGRAVEGLADALFRYICWPAGLAIGAGADPCRVLERLDGVLAPLLSPDAVAHSLFRATLLPGGHALEDWTALWPRLAPAVARFLDALEDRSGAVGLKRQAFVVLERLVVELAERPPDEGGALRAALHRRLRSLLRAARGRSPRSSRA